MKLEHQVCSLEQAKRLKELGIIQDSFACYIGDDNPDPRYHEPYELMVTDVAYSEVGASWYDARIAAFTSAELGEMLPKQVSTYFNKAEWYCEYIELGTKRYVQVEASEARARAKMILRMLEEKEDGYSINFFNSRINYINKKPTVVG
jgi:hypothetical protein